MNYEYRVCEKCGGFFYVIDPEEVEECPYCETERSKEFTEKTVDAITKLAEGIVKISKKKLTEFSRLNNAIKEKAVSTMSIIEEKANIIADACSRLKQEIKTEKEKETDDGKEKM